MAQTEEQVAADLASKLPRQDRADESSAPIQDEPGDHDALRHDLPLDSTILRYELLDYFNIGIMSRHSGDVQEQIGTIMDWAKGEAEERSLGGILKLISRHEHALGFQASPDRLFRLYKYVRLAAQRKAIDAKMETMV